MALLDSRTGRNGTEAFPGDLTVDPKACACGLVQVSWDELALLCRRLAGQLRERDQPEVVVALARAGYVPGAILACMLRCDLVTLRVPPTRSPGDLALDQPGSLGEGLAGRRVLIVDETTRTGKSLAWAVRVAREAGAGERSPTRISFSRGSGTVCEPGR